jgi:hypothetical protein
VEASRHKIYLFQSLLRGLDKVEKEWNEEINCKFFQKNPCLPLKVFPLSRKGPPLLQSKPDLYWKNQLQNAVKKEAEVERYI